MDISLKTATLPCHRLVHIATCLTHGIYSDISFYIRSTDMPDELNQKMSNIHLASIQKYQQTTGVQNNNRNFVAYAQ